MNLRTIVTTTSVSVAILAACLTTAGATGSTPDTASTASATASAPAQPLPTLGHGPRVVRKAAATAADACGYTAAVPADRFKGIPTFDAAQAARPYSATLVTTQGLVSFRALTDKAPCTTYSFRFLASRGYYNLTHCHRLTLQRIYVLQCGDPTGTGSGGPGYAFNDENLTGATYPAGTVAMANAGPNTNGSQFFITWKDTKLSSAYTPFGVVTGGMSVLTRIAAAGDDSQNGPGDGYPNAYVGILGVPIRFAR